MALEITITQNFDLTKISRRLLKLAGATLAVIGESYARQVREDVVKKNLFKSRSGHLLQSITALPESRFRVVIYGAGKNPFFEYGKFLEYGTKGPYTIKPKHREYLIIPTPTGYVKKKLVIHPGIRARHYFFGNYENRMEKAFKEGRTFFKKHLKEVENGG